MSSPKGNCFVVALQMVHDSSTESDIIPTLLANHEIDCSEIDFSSLRLVHGTGLINGVRRKHAWVELDKYAIDYSNGNKVISIKEYYYDPNGNDLVGSIFLEREQVLALLLDDPDLKNGFYWGDLSSEYLAQVLSANDVSTYQNWDRNFLEEFEQNQNLQ